MDKDKNKIDFKSIDNSKFDNIRVMYSFKELYYKYIKLLKRGIVKIKGVSKTLIEVKQNNIYSTLHIEDENMKVDDVNQYKNRISRYTKIYAHELFRIDKIERDNRVKKYDLMKIL